jgi:hypothetical protein
VRDAVPLALADDWREERCDDFMKHVKGVLMGKDQDTLFNPTKKETVDALKKLPGAGYPMRRTLIDSLVQAVEDGQTGGTGDGDGRCGRARYPVRRRSATGRGALSARQRRASRD